MCTLQCERESAMQSILAEIALNTAHSIGAPFLAGLVKSMRTAMDATVVFITVGVGKPVLRARSISSWTEDGKESSFEYDLEGAPCKLVYEGETLTISEGVYRQFPREVGFEGYVGVPLRRSDGSVMGHFAVLSRRKIPQPVEALAIVQLFAMRAEAELQRMELERELEELVASLSQATRRLTNRHEVLRQTNETKTALLGMMAHDLRNPLAVILGRSEIIESLMKKHEVDEELSEKVRKSCGSIVTTVERMDRLIASCLTQASDDAAALKLDMQELPLARACDLALALNSRAARTKSITIHYTPPGDLTVKGDEDRLVEALDNLISNALKYSHSGQAIFIEARRLAKCTEISVRDEGLGMTQADISQAFQRFQRLSAKPTAGEGSTGLGLAIVKGIVDAHGGGIRIVSKGKGMGTDFTISLPHS